MFENLFVKNKYILQFLLYSPRVYSGLDHLMVETTKIAADQGYTNVCVYTDTMEHMPQLQQDIESAGGKVELVRSSKLFRDIWRLYRKYHPVVINTHFVNKAKLYTCIISWLYRTRNIISFRSLLGDAEQYKKDKGVLKRFILGIYYYIVAKSSTNVICVSNAIKEQYIQWNYGSSKNVCAMHNGILFHQSCYHKETLRHMLNLPHDTPIVTNISAIEHIKGIDTILQSIALLKQRGVDILFAHIGGLRSNTEEQQQYANSLKQMAIELGVEDNVIWFGRRSDVQDILPMADVYVHPSRSEGLGSALLEASVAGLPLVGSRVGGIPEIVQHGVNGLLVDADNAEQLADAIEQVLTLKNNYGERARKMVYQQFNQTKQAHKLLNLYNIIKTK